MSLCGSASCNANVNWQERLKTYRQRKQAVLWQTICPRWCGAHGILPFSVKCLLAFHPKEEFGQLVQFAHLYSWFLNFLGLLYHVFSYSTSAVEGASSQLQCNLKSACALHVIAMAHHTVATSFYVLRQTDVIVTLCRFY